MSDLIQWPAAKYWTAQWNPIIGCKPCSPACENCYAAAWAKRFRQSFKPHYTAQKIPWKGVVFCGNMTDLFGEWVPSPKKFIYEALMAQYQTHPMIRNVVYLWLTKRPERLFRGTEGFNDCVNPQILARHFFGFTAENQEWYDRRFTEFKKVPTVFKGWLSAEPLLGPIDLGLDHVYPPEAAPFQWLVVGCESGLKRRPCKIEWVESIVEQCRAAKVPVFVKQLDIGGKCVTDITKFPKHLQIRQVPWAEKGERK